MQYKLKCLSRFVCPHAHVWINCISEHAGDADFNVNKYNRSAFLTDWATFYVHLVRIICIQVGLDKTNLNRSCGLTESFPLDMASRNSPCITLPLHYHLARQSPSIEYYILWHNACFQLHIPENTDPFPPHGLTEQQMSSAKLLCLTTKIWEGEMNMEANL